jgi:hypothetical protein
MHALSGGRRGDLVGEVELARVHHMRDAQRPQQRALFFGACGREYLGTAPLRELHRSEADTTGRGMNQHAFAALQPCQAVQAVVGGEEGYRQRGCIFGTQLSGQPGKKGRRNIRLTGHARRHKAEDLIADRKFGHTSPSFDHDAGAFGPERNAAARIHAQGQQHVAEIQASGKHAQAHFVGLERHPFHWTQTDAVKRAGAQNFEALQLRRRQVRLGAIAFEARRPRLTGAQPDLADRRSGRRHP